MIKDARLCKEIVVTVLNKIGVLADISKVLAEHGVNVEAVAGYSLENKAMIMLVAEDNLRAVEALKKSGYKSIREREAVLVELENKPGALKTITTKLALKEIDINQIYGTTCSEECPSTIILSTSDNEKALVVFKK
ncbi:MAG: ACT domain-containing protein [Candidatus Omnitrophica bacterium]|nr:ACT domain-containing protein [Candidatus Omnitrophota bacterium]